MDLTGDITWIYLVSLCHGIFVPKVLYTVYIRIPFPFEKNSSRAEPEEEEEEPEVTPEYKPTYKTVISVMKCVLKNKSFHIDNAIIIRSVERHSNTAK